MEAAYGVVSTVYIREEQSATINNKLYLDILTGIYYCRNKRNIYKKKKKKTHSVCYRVFPNVLHTALGQSCFPI